MEKKYKLDCKEDDPQVIQLLEDRIYEYNSGKLKNTDGHLFSKVLRNEKGEVVAGVGGWIWAAASEITQLWVHENFRGLGVGKVLLMAAEQEARSKKCTVILVKTYSFQAPHFYLKAGYRIEHILNGFPKPYSYYTLTKDLVELDR